MFFAFGSKFMLKKVKNWLCIHKEKKKSISLKYFIILNN